MLKVIGKGYDVLAVDILKQEVGQLNVQLGAVVFVLLPAGVAFAVDRRVAHRQIALLTSQAVPRLPPPRPRVEPLLLMFCSLVALYILGILVICQIKSLFRFWPYDLFFSLKTDDFTAWTAAAGKDIGIH